MEKNISIDHKDFKENYNLKENQLIIIKFNSNFVDPVNSFMKISDDMENSFLFESLKEMRELFYLYLEILLCV